MSEQDMIKGLEETIAAQAQRLGEMSKLRDLAHAAKSHLIGEHATERGKRQVAEALIDDARVLLGSLRSIRSLDGHPVLEYSDAWLRKERGE